MSTTASFLSYFKEEIIVPTTGRTTLTEVTDSLTAISSATLNPTVGSNEND